MSEPRKSRSTAAGPLSDSRTRPLLRTLMAGVFIAALDTAIIGPAIPALRASFGVDNRQIGLVMIVFVMCALSGTALLASLGDRHGRRPVFIGGLACFALGSLVIATAPGFWMILVGRAIQGFGGGGIIPTASAMIGDSVPPGMRGRALGLIGAIYGIAFVLGPPLAALLMSVAGWRWIFLINLPLCAVVVAMALRALPTLPARTPPLPIDVAGIATVFALLATIVLGITRIADHLSGLVLWPWLLALAALLLALLLRIESRAAQPVIPLALFAGRRLATAYALNAGAGFGMGAVVFLTSVATLAHGLSAEAGGFALLPLVLCSMLGSMLSGRLLNRQGPRRLILVGFSLLAGGYAACAIAPLGLFFFLLATMPVGAGVGVVVGGALRTIAIDESPVSTRGAAQGLVNIFTSIGTLLSAATIGALADAAGGGATGFALAYLLVAILMLGMVGIAITLRDDRNDRTMPGTVSADPGRSAD